MISPEDKIYRPLRLSRLDRALGFIPAILAILLGAVAVHLTLLLALPAVWPVSAYRALAARAPLGAPWLAPRPGVNSQVNAQDHAQDHAQARDGGFADPFAALTICRFDLSRGPLRLTANADGERPFSLSIRLADGAIVYSSNDRQTPKGRFDVVILTQAQADAQDAAQEAAQEAAQATAQAAAQEPDAATGAEADKKDGSNEKLSSEPAASEPAAAEKAEAGDAETNDAKGQNVDPPLRLIAPATRGFALFRTLARNEADYPAAAASRAAISCTLSPAP